MEGDRSCHFLGKDFKGLNKAMGLKGKGECQNEGEKFNECENLGEETMAE